jgi:hypothetical protein
MRSYDKVEDMSEDYSPKHPDDPPSDGIDRCRWLGCYVAANGAGAPLCNFHKDAPGAQLIIEALDAGERMYVFAKTEDEMRQLENKTRLRNG